MSETDKQQVYIRLADHGTSFLCTVQYEESDSTPQSAPAVGQCNDFLAEDDHPVPAVPASVPCMVGDPVSQLEKDQWISKFAGVLRETDLASEHSRR